MGAVITSNASSSSNTTTERVRLETDMYPARAIQVIDLGHHLNTYPDAEPGSKKHELMITFEISELMEPNEEGESLPYVLSKNYTYSLNEKSNLYKDLVAWRAAKFTADELRKFELNKVLDKPCLLNIVKVEGKGKNAGRFFNNIASVNPLPKAMTGALIERVNPLVDFGIDDIDKPVFDELYNWVQEKVLASDEGIAFSTGAKPVKKEEPAKTFTPESEVPF